MAFVSLPASSPVLGGPPPLYVFLPPSSPALGGPPPIYVPLPSGSFSPLQLGATLKLWLRGDLGVTNVSGKASAWADQSGNGNGASQGTALFRPTITASSINGKQCLTFDKATGTIMTGATSPVASGAARTLIVVCRPVNTLGQIGGAVYDSRSAAPDYAQWVMDLGGTDYYMTIPAGNITGNVVIAGSTNYLIETYFDGANFTVKNNHAAVTLSGSASGGNDSGTTGYSVGDRVSSPSTFAFNGDIGEIIVCDTVLAGANLTSTLSYILSYWAL